jgi:hypothetical protein
MRVSPNFLQLQNEIRPYFPMLEKASEAIIDQSVSDYPVFVFHQQEIELGIPVVDRLKVKGNWSVNASTMEEFVSKSLIKEEKIEEFKNKYKDSKDYYCLFVLSEMGAQFIFMPKILPDKG